MIISLEELCDAYGKLGLEVCENDDTILTFCLKGDNLIMFHSYDPSSGCLDSDFVVEDASRYNREIGEQLASIFAELTNDENGV